MKSVRQKRIEEDNNKEWAQIRYTTSSYTIENLPQFTYPQKSSSSTKEFYNNWNWDSSVEDGWSIWHCEFNRGETVPTKYFNKEDLHYGSYGTVQPLYYAHFFYIFALETINKYKMLNGQYYKNSIYLYAASSLAKILIVAFLKAWEYLGYENIYDMLEKKEQKAISYVKALTLSIISAQKEALSDLYNTVLAYYSWTIDYIFERGMYRGFADEVDEVWAEFVDRVNEQVNILNTSGYYDEDDVWHWNYKKYICEVKVKLSDKLSLISSSMRLFKNRKLIRGRYQTQEKMNTYHDWDFDVTRNDGLVPEEE